MTNPLVGAWRMVSYELVDEDGAITHPWGEQPRGMIVYTSDGFVSVAFMAAGRRPFESMDRSVATFEERAAAAATYSSYCGTYEYLGGRVVHHVEVSLFPNFIGQHLERTVDLNGDTLVLSTAPHQTWGKRQQARITWRRAVALVSPDHGGAD